MGMPLGNILPEREGPRGRDLHAAITVPRSALGRPHPVEVPLDFPIGAVRVRRATGPDEGVTTTLNLPADFPDGASIRLRGLGEAIEGGHAGDLILEVELTDKPMGPLLWAVVLALVAAIAVAVAAWLAFR